jgi:bacteriorhodopsin
MFLVIEIVLALGVLLGVVTLLYGSRRFQLSTKMLAVTFAITAASWVAFLVMTIGLTLIAIAPSFSG